MERDFLNTATLYQIYIEYIRHENELLNHRTTWFLAIETAMVAAAGYLILHYFESVIAYLSGRPDSRLSHIFEFMLTWFVVSGFGLITARGARRSIQAALDAQDSIVAHWLELALPGEELAKLPDLMGGKSRRAREDGGHLADTLVRAACWFWAVCLVLLAALALCLALALAREMVTA